MSPSARAAMRRYGLALWLLLALFALRVLAQLLQVGDPLPWLPPFDAWHGGVLPYPALVAAQLVILGAQTHIARAATGGRFRASRTAARIWLGLSSVYFASMAARLALGLTVLASDRWFGARLPTFFHLVLASYGLAVGLLHRRLTREPRAPGPSLAPAARCLLLALCVFTLPGCQTYIARFVLPRDGVRAPEHSVRIERDLALETSDGVTLRADVYHPIGAGTSPTILVRIPFSSTFYNRLAADGVARFWASRGYTVVVQGTRGRYKSDGSYYPLRHERSDGIETLRWLARQSWFDGRLGMWGGSAFGYTEWVLADQGAPGPSALMIQIASTSFGETFHPGGAFALESALFWAVRSHGARDELPDFESLERGFQGFPLVQADERAAGQDIAFFDDWATHAPDDAYWREIDGQGRASRLRAPTLLMAGWYDPFLSTQLRDYAEIRAHADPDAAREVRLIVGPWTHADALIFPDGTPADAYRPASLAPSVAWFDHHLLARPLDASLAAPVRIFVLGENVWREEQEWPLARTEYRALYLRSGGRANSRSGDGRLDFAAPTAADPPDRFVFDPERPVPSRGGAMLGPRAGIREQGDVEARDDVLVYTTDPLELDLEVTGPLETLLHVTTSAPSTDFTVKLVDVHPDGNAYNVSEGILRRAYTPDARPEEIRIELAPTSMLFRKGHRIRVEVSSSSFPRYDRNPNTGRDIATETAPRVARQVVHHGAGAPSRIVLPVIPR